MTVSKPKMVNVRTPLSKYVTSGRRNRTTKIAWHYTGSSGVKAKSTVYNWFLPIAQGKHPKSYASAHFTMEHDGTIYSMIPLNYVAYTTNSANSYSIGIECATLGKDDHYGDEEYRSMVHLGAWLCQTYKLDPRKDFIRHWDITRKNCPRYFVSNKSKWEQFKLDCYNLLKGKIKLSDVKNCTNGKGEVTKVPSSNSKPNDDKKPSKPSNKKKMIKNISKSPLNIRSSADWNGKVIDTLKPGESLTYVAKVNAKNGDTDMYKTISGTFITSSSKYVKLIEI